MQPKTPLKLKNNLLWNNRFVLLSGLMAAGIMLIVYACTSVAPFGDNTVLRMDLYHQYGPLFAELYDRIFSHGSPTYSWTSGLGSCFLGNYFNYMSSPIGAVVVFFGHKHVPEAIAAMVLIKCTLSACTFTWYLKRALQSHTPIAAAFGFLYSFCGYMLAYYWNVMWLDAMVLLPLLLYGIEAIINRQKVVCFTAVLALSMFSNYYMSYMLCLFSVVYFLYYYFAHYKPLDCVGSGRRFALTKSRFLRSGLLFAGGALLAGGLMACALLPTYEILKNCSATSGAAPTEWKTYFNFFDFFANHLAGLTTTIRSSGNDVLPNIYCGMLTVLLAPLYFFTKSIDKREKAATLALLALFFVSFNFNRFNYYWHGMHFPNDLPYRFSFMYSFLLLVMGYKTFRRLREFTGRQLVLTGVLLLAFIVIVQDATSKNVTDSTVYWSMLFLVIHLFLMLLIRSKRKFTLSLAMLVCVFCCSEAIICDTPDFPNNITRESYAGDYDDFRVLKDRLDSIEQDDFYRMELTDLRTRMDPCWFGYNGVSVFSSMAYEKLAKLESRLGMMSNKINSFTYNPQTPVYNAMHALKYVVNNAVPSTLSEPHYKYAAGYGKYTAFRVSEPLPLGYCVKRDIRDWDPETGDPFDLQADYFLTAAGLEGELFRRVSAAFVNYNNCEPFAEDLSGTQFYFRKVTAGQDASATFSVSVPKSANMYLYFAVDGASGKDVNVASVYGTITQSTSQNCILDLGYCEEGEMINVTIPFERDTGFVTFEICSMDEALFQKAYDILNANTLLLTKHSDTELEGRFTAKEDCLLYTSIPYDTGWIVTLDGKPVAEEDIVAVGDALLGIQAAKGNHEIHLRYEVPSLANGLFLSGMTAFVCLLLLMIHLILRRRRRRKRLESGEAILLRQPKMPVSEDLFLAPPAPEMKPTPQPSKPQAPKPGLKRELIQPQKKPIRREVILPPERSAADTPTLSADLYDITEIDLSDRGI